jgi:hypothetical protein
VLEGTVFATNKGLYVGTKSAHKLFAIIVRRVLEVFREATGFSGAIDYYVDDFLFHCDKFQFAVRDDIVNCFGEACARFGLSLNRKKIEFFSKSEHSKFVFAGREIALSKSEHSKFVFAGREIALSHPFILLFFDLNAPTVSGFKCSL